MRSYLPAVLALILLVSYGVAEGLWTDRWHTSDVLERAIARLDQVPRRVGDWEGQDQELDPRQMARAEIDGYLMRRYVQRSSGAEVNVLLVCGRAGPTALHSPDVCYAGAGFTAAVAPARHEVSSSGRAAPDVFWVGEFHKSGPVPEPLRIYWAWSADGIWQATNNPRVELAYHPALYKLYVLRALPRSNEPLAEDPSLEFLRQFLPEVQRALAAGS
jgi:hypothetical protein